MDISVQIFTIAGKIVKTINESINSQGFRVSDINWDGKDDFGDQLAKGTYLYKIKIRANSDISAESEFERLVILK
jgi:flagellar hook assembly protein FlgD